MAGRLYFVHKTATALSTTNDFFTVTSHATRALRVRAFSFVGGGTASAANEILVSRVGTLGITPVAITPIPLDASTQAAGFTAASGWTTQPVVGAALFRFGLNANGGVYVWRANSPDEYIELPAGAAAAGQLSFRSAAGTSTVTGSILLEEI